MKSVIIRSEIFSTYIFNQMLATEQTIKASVDSMSCKKTACQCLVPFNNTTTKLWNPCLCPLNFLTQDLSTDPEPEPASVARTESYRSRVCQPQRCVIGCGARDVPTAFENSKHLLLFTQGDIHSRSPISHSSLTPPAVCLKKKKSNLLSIHRKFKKAEMKGVPPFICN